MVDKGAVQGSVMLAGDMSVGRMLQDGGGLEREVCFSHICHDVDTTI